MIEITRSNRRRHRRVAVDMKVDEVDRAHGSQSARAVDISVWGIRYFKLAGAPPRRGGEVYLEFSLPHEEQPVRVFGIVASDRSDELFLTTSVRFTQLTEGDAGRIRGYLNERRAA